MMLKKFFSADPLITADTPILVTSAIRVSSPFTRLTDSTTRLRLLSDSLIFWAAQGVKKIVICDGSTPDIASKLSRVLNISSFDARLEILGFQNSADKVAYFGKGYGEGEIVKYAIENSIFLADSDFFVKCTGRLMVTNYWQTVSGFGGDYGASFGGMLFLPQYIDTRFYISSKRFFVATMLDAYKSVNDKNRVFLENVYFAVLVNSGCSRWVLPTPPKYSGFSGSSGKAYMPDRLYMFRLASSMFFSFLFGLRQYFRPASW